MVINKRGNRRKAIFEIANLVIALFAFAFLIALSSESVSGQNPNELWMRQRRAAELGGDTNIGGVPPAMPGASQTFGGIITQPLLQGLNPSIKIGSDIVWKDLSGKVVGVEGDSLIITTPQRARVLIPKDELPNVGAPAQTTPAGEQSGFMAGLKALQANTLISSLVYSAGIGGVVYFVAGLFGASANTQKALFAATFAAVESFQLLGPLAAGGSGWNMELFGLSKELWAGKAGGPLSFIPQGWVLPIAIGIGVAVFIMMYKKTSVKTITFDCKPYEAPTGGNYCELCNQDKLRPCSEYRCKSLGQNCGILNAGTGQEKCAWINPHDVKSAGIKKLDYVLTRGHKYTDYIERPEGGSGTPGRYTITREGASDGCIKAFTPITFGINTTEPTQCKIDYNTTINTRDVKNAFDTMEFYFGESSLFSYEHSQTLRLPGPAALKAQNVSPEINNDGTYNLFVRCKDGNGNINEDEFAIHFCVEKGPDTTAPVIEGTSIANNMPVTFNIDKTDIEVYVNEPADCKWSKQDKDYDQMENEMVCDRNVWEMNTNMLYKCATTLTGLENRKDNDFYFRCLDQPYAENQNDRIKNSESYKFTIKGTEPLNIKANSVKPNGTIQGFADIVSVDLTLETENGYNKGDAICYFSQQNIDSSFIKMFETGTNKHKQNLQLPSGQYTYYFKCVDLGANADYNSTSFRVEIDKTPPQVVRILNEGSNLKVETDEKSTCYYSENLNNKCNYEIETGKQMLYQNQTSHYIEWKPNTNVYIKCVDSSGNQPNPLDCSIIVRTYNSPSSS